MRRYALESSLPGAPFWFRTRREAFRQFRRLREVNAIWRLYSCTPGRARLIALYLPTWARKEATN